MEDEKLMMGKYEYVRTDGLSISSPSLLNSTRVRPVTMFTELVEVNGKKVPRFKYIRPQGDDLRKYVQYLHILSAYGG